MYTGNRLGTKGMMEVEDGKGRCGTNVERFSRKGTETRKPCTTKEGNPVGGKEYMIHFGTSERFLVDVTVEKTLRKRQGECGVTVESEVLAGVVYPNV